MATAKASMSCLLARMVFRVDVRTKPIIIRMPCHLID